MEAVGLTYATNKERPKRLIDYLSLEQMPEESMLELLVQGLRTLSEFVQGPVEENQVEMANARVTVSVISILEFLGCYFWKGFLPKQNMQFSGDNKKDIFKLLMKQIRNVKVWKELPQF